MCRILIDHDSIGSCSESGRSMYRFYNLFISLDEYVYKFQLYLSHELLVPAAVAETQDLLQHFGEK